jgi:rhamnose utilization protein RhaD (predicted bifunctional aldolase and dehydrogenase)/NAD(P)-dependent dehydrogenase (short-subunit alcohol dehydrogenase family)
MRNRWDETAAPPARDAVAQLVYGSRLLGSEPTLVLHGGGNSSVKVLATDITGDPVEVLYVKGSGWDLARIETPGFTPLRLDRLHGLLRLARLSDTDMMNELRCAALDAGAPDPSVETLLHALLPFPAVLHTHADAVVSLTNQADPAAVTARVFGDQVVFVPYVMPGFDLARTCAEIFPRQAQRDTVGLVLAHHGLFTFGADVAEAYHRHIDLITRAQRELPRIAVGDHSPPPVVDPLRLARLRRDLSEVAGAPMVLTRHDDPVIRAFVNRPDLATVAGRGPATPDHVLHTKRIPLVGEDIAGYAEQYRQYFEANAGRARTPLTMLDPAPRVILDPAFGLLTAGRRAKDSRIVSDIYRHTIDVIDNAEAMGGYRALPAAALFDVEYWELEQAKLRRLPPAAAFTGEVALVTGAASGIGRACAEALRARGACVVGLDIADANETVLDGPDYLGVTVDVTNPDQVDAAITRAVEQFGGLDLVVAAAGVFPDSHPIAELDPADWRRTMAVNVDSIAHLFRRVHPLLSLSPRGGRVVLIASKNAPAPGPGAAAYSASKAAAVQLARVAALEWAADGIRVNIVHPDAVFDTGLWSPQLLADRAERYGLSVEQYKRRNLLHTEITSAQVGDLVAVLCTDTFAATTGAQIPIDGGNDRVI